ncbi:MAG: GAF domain-containing protein [Chloroflexota bacterium]|nr:GAF domain-containing protein [Chloroflexota bacterium]
MGLALFFVVSGTAPLSPFGLERGLTLLALLSLSLYWLLQSTSIERLPWSGLASALLLVTIISIGTGEALLLGLVASAAVGVWNTLRRTPTSTLDMLWQSSRRWLELLPLPLVVLGLSRLFSVPLPYDTLQLAQVLLMMIMLLVGYMVRLAIISDLAGGNTLRLALRNAGYQPPVLILDLLLHTAVPVLAVLWLRDNAWTVMSVATFAAAFVYNRLDMHRQQAVYEQDISTVRQEQALSMLVLDAEQEMLEALDRNQSMEIAVKAAVDITAADAAAFYRVNTETQVFELTASYELSAEQRRQWATLPGHSDNWGDELVHIHREHADKTRYPELQAESPYQMAIEKLLRSNNTSLGLLRLYYHRLHRLTPAQSEHLLNLTRYSASLLDNIDWYEIMENYAYEMAQLAHLSRASSASLSMDEVLKDMIRILRQMVSVKTISLALMTVKHNGAALMELKGDALQDDDRVDASWQLARVPELVTMRTQQRPRPQQYKETDSNLSPGMRELLRLHGRTLAIFPLLSYYDLLGFILLGDAEVRSFSDHQWQLLEMASNQIAAHVLNARLYTLTTAASAERLEQLNILATIAQQISSALDPDTILSTLLEMAVRSTGASAGKVAILQESDETWKVLQYTNGGTLERSQRSRASDEGVIGQVARMREAVLIRDTRETTLFVGSSNPNLYLSSVGVPLISENRIIGVLQMESLRPDFFSPEETEFLKNLARHAVISIENARMLEDRQNQIMTLKHLQSLSLQLSSVTEMHVVATQVVKTALDMLNGRSGVLFAVDAHGDQARLTMMAETDLDDAKAKPSDVFKTSGATLRAAQTRQIEVVQEIRQIENGDKQHFYALSVPIVRGGRVHEILCVGFDKPRVFVKRDLEAVALLASQAAGHLENTRLHEYIRAGNDRMRAILNSTRDGVILLDKQGRLNETNPSARRLLGIDFEKYIGQSLVNVLQHYISDEAYEGTGYSREQVNVLTRHLRLEPERITRREFSRQTPKQTLYIEEIGSPVVDSDGQISGRLLVLRDITEQKQLEAYRDEITHMAVHDLRGPLASIISSLSFTLDEPGVTDDEDTLRKTLGLSLDSANNLMRLVESLLDIARLERREMPLKLAPVQLPDIINHAIDALSSSIQNANVTIKRNFVLPLSAAIVDQDFMRRVLINLIDNAIRFTPAEGTVLVETMECPDSLLIHVADSGPGIPSEQRERIFERFSQIKGNAPLRGSKGHGLGLTLCKLVVEAHGGRIWVENDSPLSGACFAISLPLPPQQSISAR